MSVSVIVPCHRKHVDHLPALLDQLQAQSVLPDEVVIALTQSQCADLPPAALQQLLPRPFAVHVVWTEGRYPGNARNRACEASTGDLLICQDADDVPHPQRIEILKHLFERYPIDLLIHQWMPSTGSFGTYALEDAERAIHEFARHEETLQFELGHNGNPALTRAVFEAVRWTLKPTGEDLLFNQMASHRFTHKVFLAQPLVMYRWELSSYRRS